MKIKKWEAMSPEQKAEAFEDVKNMSYNQIQAKWWLYHIHQIAIFGKRPNKKTITEKEIEEIREDYFSMPLIEHYKKWKIGNDRLQRMFWKKKPSAAASSSVKVRPVEGMIITNINLNGKHTYLSTIAAITKCLYKKEIMESDRSLNLTTYTKRMREVESRMKNIPFPKFNLSFKNMKINKLKFI